MKKTSVVALGIAAAFVGCCGLSALFGQSQRAAREAAEEQQDATEEASTAPVQPDPQAQGEDVPSAQPRVPAWQDPTRVAGEEAGMAAGLAYSRVFELGHQVWKAGKAGSADPVLTVAKREGLEAGVVEDAMVTYNTERPVMAEYLSGVLGRGVVGKVEVQGVEADDIGPFTARAVVVLTGCPGRSDLPFLAQTAATKMVDNLPASASGYTAILEYEGVGCSRTRMGQATYNAATAKLTLE